MAASGPWEGAGERQGVQVWRVESFRPVLQKDPKQLGKFFTGALNACMLATAAVSCFAPECTFPASRGRRLLCRAPHRFERCGLQLLPRALLAWRQEHPGAGCRVQLFKCERQVAFSNVCSIAHPRSSWQPDASWVPLCAAG